MWTLAWLSVLEAVTVAAESSVSAEAFSFRLIAQDYPAASLACGSSGSEPF